MFKKIVNPAICKGWTHRGSEIEANGFCKIEISDDGRLSITGVIGPRSSGNCAGSCGQCVDEIRDGRPNVDGGWDRQMLDKFCDIWNEWHLNDMRAYCSHMKELGWRKQASEPVTIRFYTLKSEAMAEQHRAEKAALNALRDGKPFFPTQDQVFYATLPYEIKTYDEELTGERLDYYQPKKKIISSDTPMKTERRGWLRYDECEKGLLCKPCPVCGYKYGTNWLKEDLPDDVIAFLQSLPDTKIQPAWC